ncbi:phosphatase PAP2 family protein [Saccharomonospora sp.]|uniref:phosphatase PAP2 family protein n=1 Tax=Saccharomonospora sp. TaxID=33913 RepID=UPI00261F6F4F|nr:phosphatase PAP2 family protein [Saccharomonospora sp.]
MFHEVAETVPGGRTTVVPTQATTALDVDGVPDVSAELYRAVLDAANAAPPWFQHFAVFFTEAGVVVLGLLLMFGWWRARGEPGHAMASALLAPVATLFAYGTSEIAKLLIEQDRPCRAVPGSAPLTECPAVGDWSFPSNHSTIAGGAAMAVFVCRRGRIGVTALILGALVALSRVVVGVHYPHDALVGFGLGVVVVWAALSLVAQRLTPLVERFRPHPTFGVLLGSGPATAPERSLPEGGADSENAEDDADDEIFERSLPDPDFQRALSEDETTSVLPATRPTIDSAPTRLLPRTPHWPPELTDHDRWPQPSHRPQSPRRR